MSEGRRRLAWIPPFLVGAAGAAAGELAGGLLLYSAEGLLRSLTIVLATEMLGLALGLASSRHLDPGDLAAVRHRWLAILLAYAGGTGFSAAWEMTGGFSAAPLSQALGLLLLGAVPLFSVGSVLGALAGTAASPRSVGTAAALGAAAGVVGTGLVAVPRVPSVSVFLLCVVAVSAAALLHGWLLDGRVVVRVLAENRGAAGEPVLRLEERLRGRPGARARLVTVEGRPAAGVGEEGETILPWERAAAELLASGSGSPERVLVVGAAGSRLARALEDPSGAGKIVAVEPWARLRDLGRSAEPAGSRYDGASVAEGVGEADAFDAVVVMLRLLPGGGPVAGPGLEALARFASARSATGMLVLGGVPLGEEGGSSLLIDWISRQPWSPEALALLRPRRPDAGPDGPLLLEGEEDGGGLVVGLPHPPFRQRGVPEPMELVEEGGRATEPVAETTEGRSGP